MVKCVVSGCPNRIVSYNRGVFNRPPRRFFNFPKDPDRVKVWLAALRETDKDPSEQHVICEDHFLSEDISKKGLISDAIPITPPFFDRPLSQIRSGPEACEDDDQWAAGDCNDDGEEDEGGASSAAPNPPKQDPGKASENPPVAESISDSLQQEETPSNISSLDPVPLSRLTLGFLELLLAAPGGSVTLRRAAASLKTPRRRVQNLVSVLEGIGLVQESSDCSIRWTGNTSICSFLWRSPLTFLTALEKLQLVENKLDRLIKSCSQQLLDLTDNVENAALAYVSCEDIARIATRDQTVIIIKAPQETRLDIPEPEEDRIQLHLLSEKSPITALTCEVGAGGRPTSGPTGRSSAVFLELKESRIRVRSAPSESCDWAEDDADGGSKPDSEVWNKTEHIKPVGQPSVMGPPCRSSACLRSSKHACSSITETDRKRIFKSFWYDMDWEQRKNYSCGLVDINPVQRRRGSGCSQRESSLVFHLSVDGLKRRVCRALFLATLGLKESISLKWIREKKRHANESGGEEFPAASSRPDVC